MKKYRIIVFLLFLFPLYVLGQTSTIKGFVYNSETGETLPFVSVGLDNTRYGTSTDINGFFVINKIEPGSYTLKISCVGNETYTEEISLKKGEVISKKIILQSKAMSLGKVDVVSSREDRVRETNVSVDKINVKQIKQIPAIGGQSDLAQYLQVLPGITFTGDQGGQLYIRGGSMIQNKVLLDKMVIYNPFHSIGLFSVFESDIISNVDVYSGAFGAEYGGRISSVMDVRTRDGNRKKLSGKIGLTTFGTNWILEGPLKKSTPESETSISYLLSAKNSYLSRTSPVLYSYTKELPYDFLDLYGKISLIGNDGSKLNLFGFNFTDKVNNYQSLANFEWQNYGFGANFIAVPGESALLEGIISYSDYHVQMQNSTASKASESNINNFTLGLYMTYFLGTNKLKYGVDVEGVKTFYSVYNDQGLRFPRSPTWENSTELSGFFAYDMIFEKLLISPSIRGHYYASLSEFSPEPRLSLKYNAFEKVRFKMAAGLYSQSLIDVRSDRDVVNLFVGFLSGADEQSFPNSFKGNENVGRIQKASHIILGMEIDITDQLLLNIESYLKHFNRLLSVNRNKIYDINSENNANGSHPKPQFLMTDFIVEQGDAYGIDFSAKYDWDRIYFWISYSLAFVNRTDELQKYNPHYDRRHNINVMASYYLGDSREWEIGCRWNFGSGFPFTTTKGAYEKLDITDINTDYITENGSFDLLYDSDYYVTKEGTILYTKLNKGRLPTYHRLDLMLKRKFSLGRNSILEANVSISNVYNRENMFYFNRVTFERLNQLPILPSAGLVLYF